MYMNDISWRLQPETEKQNSKWISLVCPLPSLVLTTSCVLELRTRTKCQPTPWIPALSFFLPCFDHCVSRCSRAAVFRVNTTVTLQTSVTSFWCFPGFGYFLSLSWEALGFRSWIEFPLQKLLLCYEEVTWDFVFVCVCVENPNLQMLFCIFLSVTHRY